MKKLSKIFAVVLCLIMAVSMLTIGVSAAEEKSVEFTVDSLGLKSQSYSASTANVDGVEVEWIQVGNYGDGIQMRDKNGNTSMFWNTVAVPGVITKIELTYSDSKDVSYSNADAVIFNFGNEVKGADYSTKLSTTSGTKSYTITPDAETYSFFYMEHDLGYTFYWKSIKVFYKEVEEEPVVTNYYVTGSTDVFSNWAECNEAGLMTMGEDGLYTKTFENVPASDKAYEMKVNIGVWSTSWGDPTSSNGNYFVTVEALSNVTVTFNAETGAISVDVVPVENEPENPGEGEQPENPGNNPGTGDMSVAGLVIAMMAATAGVVVLKKKEF